MHHNQGERPLLLKVPEVCELLKVGRDRVYQLCEAGDLRSIRFKRTILIPRASLDLWIEQQTGLSRLALTSDSISRKAVCGKQERRRHARRSFGANLGRTKKERR